MQLLGISPNTPKTQSRLRELFWPEISDSISAQTAARNGMWASFVVAAASALFALIGLAPLGALFDAFLFLLAGIGIKWMSRTAAVAGFALYIIEQLYAFANGRAGWNIVLMVIVGALLLGAIRGTFWFQRARAASREPQRAD